jgi:hypothetical protein
MHTYACTYGFSLMIWSGRFCSCQNSIPRGPRACRGENSRSKTQSLASSPRSPPNFCFIFIYLHVKIPCLLQLPDEVHACSHTYITNWRRLIKYIPCVLSMPPPGYWRILVVQISIFFCGGWSWAQDYPFRFRVRAHRYRPGQRRNLSC